MRREVGARRFDNLREERNDMMVLLGGFFWDEKLGSKG